MPGRLVATGDDEATKQFRQYLGVMVCCGPGHITAELFFI